MPETGQNLVADRAGSSPGLVEPDRRADHLGEIARCDAPGAGRNVDGERSMEMRPATGQRWPAIATQARRHRSPTIPARKAVRIAEAENRKARRPLGGPGGAVANLSPRSISRICRIGPRADDRRIGFGCPASGCRHKAHSRAAPCRRPMAWPAGRGRRNWRARRECPGNSRAHRAKASICLGLSGCGGSSAQARWLISSAMRSAPRLERPRRAMAKAKPVHAGVDMQRRAAAPARCCDETAPFGEYPRDAAEHRTEVGAAA